MAQANATVGAGPRIRDARLKHWKGFELADLAVFRVRHVGLAVEIPYFDEECELYRRKVFPLSGHVRATWTGPSKPQIPYGLETLRFGGNTLFLTEGESDSLALRLAFPRTPVLGIPGASAWQAEWAEYAKRFAVVYLSFDGDSGGRKLVDTVWPDVPQARMLRLTGGNDTRDVLQRQGRDAYEVLLDDADLGAGLSKAILAAAERSAG